MRERRASATEKKNNAPLLPSPSSPPPVLPPRAAFNALKDAYHPEVAPDAAETLEKHKGKMPYMTNPQLNELIKRKVPEAKEALEAKQEAKRVANVKYRTNAG